MIKINGIINGSVTFWALSYVHCIPFSCIGSFHIVYNQANYIKKIFFPSFKKLDQNSINLTNVFDFMG